jgi:hypothetical protein
MAREVQITYRTRHALISLPVKLGGGPTPAPPMEKTTGGLSKHDNGVFLPQLPSFFERADNQNSAKWLK